MNDIIYTVGQRISREIVNNNNLRNLASSAISTIGHYVVGYSVQFLIVHGTKLNLNVSASINSGVISIVHMSCLSGRLCKTTTYHINCNLQLMK